LLIRMRSGHHGLWSLSQDSRTHLQPTLPKIASFGYPATMTEQAVSLNSLAAALCREMALRAEELQIHVSTAPCGATLYDCGINVPGSREAAIFLARVCLADLAEVSINDSAKPWPLVHVSTNAPVRACLGSQYAGWEVKEEKYFAMGSGPMRAASGREAIYNDIHNRETASECVGVLETSKLPPDSVCLDIAAKCGVEPERLALLVAPTHSLCGTLQIVARSVETALHKLHTLGFDLSRIVTGHGTAPLPPSAGDLRPPLAYDDFAAIGRTNDAILYGGQVLLAVQGDDESLQEIGPRVPSIASADYGRPFAEIMAHYENDFYRIDPLLFSPAAIEFVNISSSSHFRFGEINHELLARSFG
jgi:methenyltetrahydromethanopterin cyclohydrolase